MPVYSTKNSPLELFLAGMPDNVRITRYETHEHIIKLFIEWDEQKSGKRVCLEYGSVRCIKKAYR